MYANWISELFFSIQWWFSKILQILLELHCKKTIWLIWFNCSSEICKNINRTKKLKWNSICIYDKSIIFLYFTKEYFLESSFISLSLRINILHIISFSQHHSKNNKIDLNFFWFFQIVFSCFSSSFQKFFFYLLKLDL